ncbi:hypothetical protein COCMIDRAFT_5499 [Bipolaris oryzae ATCC 44560]|uniref:Protein kinase domain-containing protein n=1 Tax=Bipolaris oryzae ATCC 44560 TaxID=930090 RepID=W6Z679_COCMI|nr:uncharacterized protein COCMIDRAFT_5499 [Bipolaris oryzae ATCC 44560]EUC45298.1 hypothetical protein COCMIDRAFT_5499 [Bipolaris oryzae ATCC 44560]
MAALSSLDLVGSTGRSYIFKKLIQERPHVGRVWLASSRNENFILKDIPKNIVLGFNEDIRPRLPLTPRVRLPVDTIPDRPILVYEYLDQDLLNLVQSQVSMQARKEILKAILQGIADLHDRDIVHLDVKPDNFLVSYRSIDHDILVKKVQVNDFENAGYIPKPRCVKGMLAGNNNWRSPEANFRGTLNKPTDLFSFGLVCIYAILGRIILGCDADFEFHESKGIPPICIRLPRQITYFGDQEGLNGLMKHFSDEETKREILGMHWKARMADNHPYVPFSEWTGVDSTFKDLIRGLNNLDPSRRLTARQALEHPWFEGVKLAF